MPEVKPSYEELAARLQEAEDTLGAIHRGEVDALIVTTPEGLQVFTLQGADAFYRELVEQMPEGAAALDPDGTVLYANGAFAAMLGLPLETLIGSDLTSLTRSQDRSRLQQLLEASDTVSVSELTLRRPDGALIEAAVSARRIHSGGSSTLCLVAVDQSRRKSAELAVRLAEERFRGAFDNAPIGMALVARDGVIERVNPALARLLGQPAAALVGARLPWVLPGQQLRATDSRTGPSEVPLQGGRGAGEGWAQVNISEVIDGGGPEQHFIVQVQDVSQRRHAEAGLRHAAEHDGLTDLLNRRGFEREMHAQLARGGQGALILLDVDHFKYINDSRGHQVGDLVLIALASALSSRLRASDVVARLGGDEFAVLVPADDAAAARSLAEDLVATARTVQITELVGLRELTVSAGVATVNSGRTTGELMALADLAMYDAKEAGRNGVCVYDTLGSGSETEQRMTWLSRIRSALDDKTLQVYAQPIIDLATGACVQQELLARLPGPDGVGVPASAWFDVAERYDVALGIDRWVFDQSLELLARTAGDKDCPGVCVNVSGTSIARSGLMEHIVSGFARHRVDPSRLTFEITETATIGNIGAAARFADEIHRLGCRLALDDFGAGYGSFYYLKHLPFDDVKIDGEFVRNSVNDQRDRSIVSAMVSVSASTGRRTVAECVEDAETLALMRDYGVDLAQGYFLGRPTPLPLVGDVAVDQPS